MAARALWLLPCALLTLACLGFADAQGDKKDKIDIRPIKFTPKDPTVIFSLGGQSKITRLDSPEEVEKFIGKASAKGLIDLVDLGKESIVFVSWTTSGPPEGMLKHEIKGDGVNRVINFFVQGPPGAKIRGQRARLGADFFAVPKNIKVTFEKKER